MTHRMGIQNGNGRRLGAASTGGVMLARSIEDREVLKHIKYDC
ncbi:MAG TPA: hypothetical protein VL997_14450 [Dyella sp.]|nr:hypothetical protein [Dyella sp.]